MDSGVAVIGNIDHKVLGRGKRDIMKFPGKCCSSNKTDTFLLQTASYCRRYLERISVLHRNFEGL